MRDNPCTNLRYVELETVTSNVYDFMQRNVKYAHQNTFMHNITLTLLQKHGFRTYYQKLLIKKIYI